MLCNLRLHPPARTAHSYDNEQGGGTNGRSERDHIVPWVARGSCTTTNVRV